MIQNIKYYLVLGMLHCIARLPFCVLYPISTSISFCLYRIVGYRLRTVRENLFRVFPEKGEDWHKKIERAFYLHLSDCIIETVKLLHMSDEEIDNRVEVTNGELIERLAADGNPFIAYLGHYGNWEWVQAFPRHYRRPAVNGEIYRQLHDGVMNKIMLRIRSRFPNRMIRQKEAVRTILRMVRQGDQPLIGFIADQRPNSKQLHHWTTFLGQETAYAVGGEEIGCHINAHFIYIEVNKWKRGHYRITVKEVLPNERTGDYPYTKEYLRMLEQTIRTAPQYWLWSHKRWRITRK